MAEVAGGMLASAVLKVVFTQIVAVIGGHIKLQKDFTKDLKKMKMTLESLTAVLKDAEKKSIQDSSVQLWLKRLKNALYDISDMLDEFEADTQPAVQKMSLKKGISGLASIGPKTKLANRMKKMRGELKEITDQHVMFRLEVGSVINEEKIQDTRETAVVMNDEEIIVGRAEEKMKIMVSLSTSITEKLTIFPIYGIGGIGKTTMAKMVFNDTQFSDYSRVWIYVSQSFRLKKICNSIISQLSKSESQITEMQMIHTRLVELLAGKNVLIVLDDLWEDNDQFQLDELKKMLKVSEDSKIIVIITTRNKSIANDLYTVEPYKLAPLSDDSCWTIIKQKSALDSRADKIQLEQIGKEIARKCGGVALAAKVIGHMLRTFTYDEWESVRNSNIWNVSTFEETHPVLSSLRLTYSYMPSPLRLCFAYCAIFPKGQKMVKDDLIYEWISLGFIETTHVLTTRQLGEKYITQLLGLSFLEHSAIGLYHEDAKHLTMHDLVHDLARFVLVDEIILGVSKLCNTEGSSSRYALLDDCSKKLESYTDSPAKIRALRFHDCGKTELQDYAFSSAKYLRVLDLSECFIQTLPESIGQLKQLRYLNAPKVQHHSIPNCITRLLKLTYLCLCGSSALLQLPDSVGEMESLMHLDLSGCSTLGNLPDSFGKLKNLVHLDLSNCSQVTCVSESLQNLTNLEYLNLSGCSNIVELPEHLGSLLKLKHLNLSGFGDIGELPRSFGDLRNLMHLDLSHCGYVIGLPEALGGLKELQYLNLSHCQCTDGTEITEAIGNLTELRHLYLSRFLDTMNYHESTSFVHLKWICTLSNLEHLDLSHTEGLDRIPDSFDSLRKLRTLNLSNCPNLWYLPRLTELDSLKMLDLNGCSPILYKFGFLEELSKSLITLPEFEVQADYDSSSSNLALLQGINPTELRIKGLEKVRSIEEVQSINLVAKGRIKKLSFEWRGSSIERAPVENIVLGGLVPPSSIESLEIAGYSGIVFPGWLMGITAYDFRNLISVSLARLYNCISLPPLGQLRHLVKLFLREMKSIVKIDESFCGGAGAFPELEMFILHDMLSLEVWNTTYSCGGDGVSLYMFPNLRKLEIFGCPKLRLKSCPPKAQEWSIGKSDGVISCWGETWMSYAGASTSSSPPAVTTVTITRCNLPMHQWRLLHQLPALPELSINYCSDLTSSTEIIGALSCLQRLSVSGDNQAQLPDWLCHLTSLEKLTMRDLEVGTLHDVAKHLTSLQSVELSYCNSMIALPQWLGDLLCLQRLEISSCKNLNDLNEIMGCHTSLRELDIRDCQSIESLPESIQQLTKLEILRIVRCPGLQQWCHNVENKMKLAHIKQKIIDDM